MFEAFDPYEKWLGISKGEQPANYYRLLGVTAFEATSEEIERNWEERMVLVKRRSTGKRAALSQQILNELTTAKLTLLDRAKRADYDDQLMKELGQAKLQREVQRADRQKKSRFKGGEGRFGLGVPDLDHFKDVNDQYGHAAGDAAIADLASILRFEMRRNDQVFRFGGEEFVALLELDGTDNLEAATERLRKAVRSSLRGPGGRITISLGAAMLREQEKTWHDWFSRADAALYRAKSAGRDGCGRADGPFMAT